ncbi:MAG: 4-hydroxy-tetrahydrodipicolinate synthase, partial [Myxococcales bacterium]|nr:4-hydroxy-tetrahydrodipicolinate synthase [Myxococcales bacterium]
MMTLPKDFLRGSYVPLVTPFLKGEVDYAAFASLVSNQVDHGSHGIVVTGTSGEANSLTFEERTRLLEIAIDVAKKRTVVVAATGAGSFAETVQLSQHAEQKGADALLVLTPYYMKPPQRGLAEYYIQLGKATQLPFMINHNPGRTGVRVSLETMEQIATLAPTMIGIDHAVADFGFVSQILERMGTEFRIFAGFEDMGFPMLAIGASGVMNAVGNIAPRRIERLYSLTEQGAMDEARKLHNQLAELNAAIYYDTNPIPIKYMMKKVGLITHNEHRLPMLPATPELERRLDAVLD